MAVQFAIGRPLTAGVRDCHDEEHSLLFSKIALIDDPDVGASSSSSCTRDSLDRSSCDTLASVQVERQTKKVSRGPSARSRVQLAMLAKLDGDGDEGNGGEGDANEEKQTKEEPAAARRKLMTRRDSSQGRSGPK